MPESLPFNTIYQGQTYRHPAPPPVQDSIMKVLRDPIICRASIDRPNIYLACEEIPTAASKTKFSYFCMKSVRSNFGLGLYNYIYTDFIDNVGPIMNELNSHGIDSVA